MKRSGKAKKSPVKRSVKKTVATPKKAAIPAKKEAVKKAAKKSSAKISKPVKSVLPSLPATSPLWNIRDAGAVYKVRITAPGLNIKNVKINVDGNKLTVSSIQESTRADKQKTYVVREYSYSSWSRSVLLPQRVNAHDIKVRYNEGILKLDLPKF
jgi:HSP20 family molecular chaperone IbpA